MPEFVLFGDSLTEWSFSEETRGFGLFLEQKYQNKVQVVNEGKARCEHGCLVPSELLSEIVLFDALMTEWSHKEKTQYIGWLLEKKHAEKSSIVNEDIVV